MKAVGLLKEDKPVKDNKKTGKVKEDKPETPEKEEGANDGEVQE